MSWAAAKPRPRHDDRPRITAWIEAVDPPQLLATLASVCLGGALALGEPGPLTRWPVWGAVSLAAAALHTGARLLIAAADRRRARANPWQGPSLGGLPVPSLVTAACVCLAAGAGFGLLAVIERGWPLFWLGVAAFGLAIAWSHGPALRDRGLGEAAAFALFGPLAVGASYLAASGAWSSLAVRVSVPVGLIAAAVVTARAIRDGVDDSRAGVTTLAGVLHRPGVDFIFLALIAAAYFTLLGEVARGILAPICLLPWLTAPAAVKTYWMLRAHPVEGAPGTAEVAERTRRIAVRFALLLAASVAASEWFWPRAV